MNQYRASNDDDDSDSDSEFGAQKPTKKNLIIEDSDEITEDEDEDDKESSDGNDFDKSIHKAINRSIANVSIQEDYYGSDEYISEEDDDGDLTNIKERSAEDPVVIDETNSSASEAVAEVIEDDEDDQHEKDESLHIEPVHTPEQQSNKIQEANENNETERKQLNNLIEEKQKMLARIKQFIKEADPKTLAEVGQKYQMKAQKLKQEINELNLKLNEASTDSSQDKKQDSSEIIFIDSPKNDIEVATPKVDEIKEDSGNRNHSPIISGHVEGLEIMPESRETVLADIEKATREASKIKDFIQNGRMDVLPDKGERLRRNYQMMKMTIKQLKEKLKSFPEDSKSNVNPTQPSVKDRIQSQYQTEPAFSLFDNTMLKPTPNLATDELGKKALQTFQREQALTIDRLQDLHGSIQTQPAEDELADDPKGLKVPLMRHQKHALAWLLWREKQKPPGGVLADDMGLGKTLTMISLILAARERGTDERPQDDGWIQSVRTLKHRGGTLVVCPASLIGQWEEEIKRRCKKYLLAVELYHGNNRESRAKRLCKNDVVITTYGLLTRQSKDNGILYMIDWERIILDEAHIIRNHKSQTCEAVCSLVGQKRWALSGTPIQNKEMDLYSILKFLKCSPFDDIAVWKRWVDNKNEMGVKRLTTVMKSLMLRRTKQELMAKGDMKSLPEKFLEIININLDREERLVYEKILIYSKTLFAQFLAQRAAKEHGFELGAGKFNKAIENATKNSDTQFNKAQKKLLATHAGKVQSHEILVLLLRLRQVCCHPSLILSMLDQDDLEQNGLGGDDNTVNNNLANEMNKLILDDNGMDESGDIGIDERVSENLLTSENPVFRETRKSSKLRAIMELTKTIITTTDDKMIIVSQWTSNINIIAEALKEIDGATYKMFTGNVLVKNRQEIVDSFNEPNKSPRILLLSLTAGGVGLNLVGGNHLLLVDIHWNPQLESQAQDRIYRFGQTKNVKIYKYICNDTIEERIKLLQEKKLMIADSVLTGTKSKVSSKLSLNDLRSLFGL